MNKKIYKARKRLKNLENKIRAEIIWKLIWKFFPETIIYNPVIDFKIISSKADLRKITFSKVDKVIIEVGTGNGDFLVYLSKKYKKSVIIGFEVAKTYFLKTKNNIMKNLCLNAKAVLDEAFGVIENNFKDEIISKIFINFPDPWPKKKHWKRRFLTMEKFPVILRKMVKGGEIIFVTDHLEYASYVVDICERFMNNDEVEFSVSNNIPRDYPKTKYFQKWQKAGKSEYRTIRILKK